jgi:hypothetical protein
MVERQWAVAMVPADTEKGPLAIGEGCAQATKEGFSVLQIVPAFIPHQIREPQAVYAIVCYKDVDVEETAQTQGPSL